MVTPALDPQPASAPVKVFISYAHEDEELKKQLLNHLSILRRKGIISEWHDRLIPAGGNWSQQIDAHLESAQIILLLISANFLASDYCYEKEMRRALEKHEVGQAIVIPVFLRPCEWKGAPFGHIEGLPSDTEPVTSRHWSSMDEAFAEIAKGIRGAAERFGPPIGGPAFTAAESVHSGTATALHQLPPPTADFTGRADELTELLEAIKTQGVAITGLQGLGGIGKTALALKLADQLKKDYPDAQIYLDLKGVEKSPLLPREAMTYVIRSFDLAANVPEGEAEVIALYRSVLHNKRVLLLMDNAKDDQQVKPLIPPDGSLLIVTSRLHFTLPGLFDKNLDVLSAEDAGEMLCRIAPRLKKEKPETTEELARLCGFLPLALETVANALRVKVNIAAPEYAARLKDARERLKLTAADASLALSYQLLTAEQQQRFRMLAVFPDTFDAAAAAAVWETEFAVAQDALGEMLLYSLVEFNQAMSRYRLHDLARLFADNRLSTTERETSQRRHAGHFQEVLSTAGSLYRNGGESVLKGLRLFDLEWTNIQKGQSWAASNVLSDKTAADCCSDYPYQGASLLFLRQHPRDRIQWLEAALAAARRLNNRQREAAALGNLGLTYDDLGEYRLAIEYHEGHLKITRETGGRFGEGQALGNLGIAYYSLGEYRRAIEYHEQRLNIAQEVGDRIGKGRALGNLGIAYYSLGEYRRAIEYHEQRLTIVREIGDRVGEGQALGNLGLAYYSLGEYQRAIEYQELDLPIAREIGDRFGEGSALWGSSVALDALGDRAQAIARAEAALKIFEEIESPAAPKVRDQLAKWREEEKTNSQAAE